MGPHEILSACGEEKLANIVQEIRGEERRIIFSKFHLQKAGKRLLDMDARRRAQVRALWELIHDEGSEEAADDLLRAWLRDCRASLLCTFLDHFGIQHRDGITEEDDWKDKIKGGDIEGGIQKLKDEHDPVDIWIYLSFIDIPEVDASPQVAGLRGGNDSAG